MELKLVGPPVEVRQTGLAYEQAPGLQEAQSVAWTAVGPEVLQALLEAESRPGPYPVCYPAGAPAYNGLGEDHAGCCIALGLLLVSYPPCARPRRAVRRVPFSGPPASRSEGSPPHGRAGGTDESGVGGGRLSKPPYLTHSSLLRTPSVEELCFGVDAMYY